MIVYWSGSLRTEKSFPQASGGHSPASAALSPPVILNIPPWQHTRKITDSAVRLLKELKSHGSALAGRSAVCAACSYSGGDRPGSRTPAAAWEVSAPASFPAKLEVSRLSWILASRLDGTVCVFIPEWTGYTVTDSHQFPHVFVPVVATWLVPRDSGSLWETHDLFVGRFKFRPAGSQCSEPEPKGYLQLSSWKNMWVSASSGFHVQASVSRKWELYFLHLCSHFVSVCSHFEYVKCGCWCVSVVMWSNFVSQYIFFMCLCGYLASFCGCSCRSDVSLVVCGYLWSFCVFMCCFGCNTHNYLCLFVVI